MATTYRIMVNDTRVYIEGRPGPLRTAEESGSEQCEGCGADIVETGTLRVAAGHGMVTCGDCGSFYLAVPVDAGREVR